MVTRYGMSERLGLAAFEAPRSPVFLAGPTLPAAREYADATARAIDEEVIALLGAARARVVETLTGRRPALEALARLLLEKETVDRAAIEALLSESAVAPAREATADVRRRPGRRLRSRPSRPRSALRTVTRRRAGGD